jgi:hypothetical protein
MDINDYLIDQSGKDWMALLKGWGSVLPASFTLWLVNRFGDLIIVLDDGSVHMLDLGSGQLSRLADSRDQFAELLDIDDNANDWLMIPLVDRLVAAGMTLGPDRCYGFKIPPVLGGSYDLENVATISLVERYASMADICRQIKDVPDGTPIKLVVTD